MPEQVKIEADIEVGVSLINGRVNGNITANQRGVLQSQARVERSINTPSLSISDVAIFEGECVFGDDGTETGPPAPMNKDEFCGTKSRGARFRKYASPKYLTGGI